jgi:hypothetical protein
MILKTFRAPDVVFGMRYRDGQPSDSVRRGSTTHHFGPGPARRIARGRRSCAKRSPTTVTAPSPLRCGGARRGSAAGVTVRRRANRSVVAGVAAGTAASGSARPRGDAGREPPRDGWRLYGWESACLRTKSPHPSAGRSAECRCGCSSFWESSSFFFSCCWPTAWPAAGVAAGAMGSRPVPACRHR